MPRIVIEVPSEFKSLAEAMKDLIDEVSRRCAAMGAGGRACDYGEVERRVGELASAVERASHEAMLGSLDVDAPRVLIAGKQLLHGRAVAGPEAFLGPRC